VLIFLFVVVFKELTAKDAKFAKNIVTEPCALCELCGVLLYQFKDIENIINHRKHRGYRAKLQLSALSAPLWQVCSEATEAQRRRER
jgi:hypothetical protein